MKKLLWLNLLAGLLLLAACCKQAREAGTTGATPSKAKNVSAVESNDLSVVPPAPSGKLPHQTDDADAPVVYFTRDISAAGLLKVYQAMGWQPTGKVGVKISTGEPPASNYLRPELIKDLVQYLNGTIVKCNTAYGGSRAASAMHHQVVKDHGFLDIAPFDLLDEEGTLELPIANGKHLKADVTGSHFRNYDSYLVLSHFKGHAMAGFGGAIKNLSIGFGSGNVDSAVSGKALIHSGGRSEKNPWCGEQIDFLESMCEAAWVICDSLNHYENVAFVNVMNRLSVDCDCNGHPEEPDMHDLGIVASRDPLAIDQCSIDMVYSRPDSAKLRARIERQQGLHTLDYGAQFKVGRRNYRLVNIDEL
ncbi:MAG: DUF362 domain-containing protein [Victivallales bacterium]|nr:DUF362 domain-containing protein [Victivallales bacterium]